VKKGSVQFGREDEKRKVSRQQEDSHALLGTWERTVNTIYYIINRSCTDGRNPGEARGRVGVFREDLFHKRGVGVGEDSGRRQQDLIVKGGRHSKMVRK